MLFKKGIWGQQNGSTSRPNSIVNCITRDKNKKWDIAGSCWFGVGFFPSKRSLPVEDYFLLLKFFFPSPVSLFLNCLW